jgi:hypothetical protein
MLSQKSGCQNQVSEDHQAIIALSLSIFVSQEKSLSITQVSTIQSYNPFQVCS